MKVVCDEKKKREERYYFIKLSRASAKKKQ